MLDPSFYNNNNNNNNKTHYVGIASPSKLN
jgi:hypothetical protein